MSITLHELPRWPEEKPAVGMPFAIITLHGRGGATLWGSKGVIGTEPVLPEFPHKGYVQVEEALEAAEVLQSETPAMRIFVSAETRVRV
jgi:hypothetical protein